MLHAIHQSLNSALYLWVPDRRPFRSRSTLDHCLKQPVTSSSSVSSVGVATQQLVVGVTTSAGQSECKTGIDTDIYVLVAKCLLQKQVSMIHFNKTSGVARCPRPKTSHRRSLSSPPNRRLKHKPSLYMYSCLSNKWAGQAPCLRPPSRHRVTYRRVEYNLRVLHLGLGCTHSFHNHGGTKQGR